MSNIVEGSDVALTPINLICQDRFGQAYTLRGAMGKDGAVYLAREPDAQFADLLDYEPEQGHRVIATCVFEQPEPEHERETEPYLEPRPTEPCADWWGDEPIPFTTRLP